MVMMRFAIESIPLYTFLEESFFETWLLYLIYASLHHATNACPFAWGLKKRLTVYHLLAYSSLAAGEEAQRGILNPTAGNLCRCERANDPGSYNTPFNIWKPQWYEQCACWKQLLLADVLVKMPENIKKHTSKNAVLDVFWSQTNYGPVPPSANKLSRSLTHRPGTGSPKRFHGIRIRQLCDRILSSTVKIVKAVYRVWGSTEDAAPKSQLRHSDQMERTPSSAADDFGQNCTVDLVQS